MNEQIPLAPGELVNSLTPWWVRSLYTIDGLRGKYVILDPGPDIIIAATESRHEKYVCIYALGINGMGWARVDLDQIENLRNESP